MESSNTPSKTYRFSNNSKHGLEKLLADAMVKVLPPSTKVELFWEPKMNPTQLKRATSEPKLSSKQLKLNLPHIHGAHQVKDEGSATPFLIQTPNPKVVQSDLPLRPDAMSQQKQKPDIKLPSIDKSKSSPQVSRKRPGSAPERSKSVPAFHQSLPKRPQSASTTGDLKTEVKTKAPKEVKTKAPKEVETRAPMKKVKVPEEFEETETPADALKAKKDTC